MRIALFGGTFDPPHLGHKMVADMLIKHKVVDAVWFVPVFQHPWASRYGKVQLTEYSVRNTLLELLLGESSPHKIVQFTQVSFTYDTLEYFSKKYPEHHFSWVMGSEYLDRFDDFLKGHPLLSKYHFYIYPRSGFLLDESLKKTNMTFLHEFPQVEISSSMVRAAGSPSNLLLGLVGPQLEKFITDNNLYNATREVLQ